MKRLALVLVACGSKDPATPPASGSAPAAPRDAVVVDAAATTAAAVVDAGPADAAAPATIDPALAARIPEVMFATFVGKSGGDLAIYKLDRTGVHRLVVDPDAGKESLGWVDAHTLLVTNERYEQDVTVARFVDGARADAQLIAHADWPKASGSLVGTTAGEAWLVACEEPGVGPEPCKRSAYLPVWPKRGAITHATPKHLDAGRFVGVFAYAPPAWMLPPTVKGPAGVKVSLRNIHIDKAVYQRDIRAMSCRAPDGSASYPDANYDPAYDFQGKTVRFVLAMPPIVELAADVTNPVAETDRNYLYFRACSDAPLAGFAWFGDGVWAAYTEPPAGTSTGTWTVYVDATPIGTFAGVESLRSNRQPARK